MIGIILSLSYVGAIVSVHALPHSLERDPAAPTVAHVVACDGLAPAWVDDEHARVAAWWADRGCDLTSYERGPCDDDCGGLPCRDGAVSIVSRPAGHQRQIELTHADSLVIELPAVPITYDPSNLLDAPERVPDLRALLLAHAVGHVCGYPDGYTRIGLGSAVRLAREGQLMSPVSSGLGWGDAGLDGPGGAHDRR